MNALHDATHPHWNRMRFAVILGAMYLLLRSQAERFDVNELYLLTELVVILFAFEAGAKVSANYADRINQIRLLIVFTGMAVLLYVNASDFDETEQLILFGLPATVGMFEGFRIWITASPRTKKAREGSIGNAGSWHHTAWASTEEFLKKWAPPIGRAIATAGRFLEREYTKLSDPVRTRIRATLVTVFLALVGLGLGACGIRVGEMFPKVGQPGLRAERSLEDQVRDLDVEEKARILEILTEGPPMRIFRKADP